VASPAPLAPGDALGLVGLGRMGAPMGRRLVEAGFLVCGFDLDPSARAELASLAGGTAAKGTADVARGARAVLLMLPDSRAVHRVLHDEGLLQALDPSTLLIDMGSSDPTATRELAREAAARGTLLVDAPVSGGVKGAVEGSLTVMVGGDEAVLDRCRPVLEVLGSSVSLVGPTGGGHAVKALNNLLSAASMLAAAEAVEAARRFGLDSATVLTAVNTSSGRSWSTEYKFPRFVVPQTYDSGFSLELMLKDVRTALELARSAGGPSELAERVEQSWARAAEELPAGADHTQIAQWAQETKEQLP